MTQEERIAKLNGLYKQAANAIKDMLKAIEREGGE